MAYSELDKKLSHNLHAGENYDVVRREIKVGRSLLIIYYISSLINEEYVADMIISLSKMTSIQQVRDNLPNATITMGNDLATIIDDVFSGLAIILSKNAVWHVDIRAYATRSVSEPPTEKTIRGSRDGFVETLNTNIGLLRRRLKTSNLRITMHDISKESQMKVAVVYMEDVASTKVLKLIEDKLSTIKVESLIMSDRALEELLFNQRMSPYPLVRYTERPDVAAINMMNGKIIIMVDTSSSVMITPATIIDHVKHVEEFRQSPLVGTFTRFIRTLAIFISVFLVPIWLTLVEPNAIHNIFSITLSSELSFAMVVVQVLVAELVFEIIRIASIHTPSHLTSAISLVAAVILGQVSMDLGLFLPEIILIAAISSICGFATPSYELSMANKLVKIMLIIITAIFGKIGLLVALGGLFLYMITIKVWNMPYLYPICPFDAHKAKNLFMRSSANKKKRL